MVTEIFARHGLWIGRTEGANRFGYRHFENIHLRDQLNRLTVRGDRPEEMRLFRAGKTQAHVRRVIKNHVPAGVRWVYKTGIDSWRLFDRLYPGIQFVFIKRRLNGVVASNMDKSGNKAERIRPIVEARYRIMDMLAAERGIPYVYTDELIAGGYMSLQAALEHCGLTFQPEIAKEVIDPGKWKH